MYIYFCDSILCIFRRRIPKLRSFFRTPLVFELCESHCSLLCTATCYINLIFSIKKYILWVTYLSPTVSPACRKPLNIWFSFYFSYNSKTNDVRKNEVIFGFYIKNTHTHTNIYIYTYYDNTIEVLFYQRFHVRVLFLLSH